MAGMQVYIIEMHIHLETNLDWYSSNVVNWSLLSSHQIIIRFKIHEIWIIGNLVRNRPWMKDCIVVVYPTREFLMDEAIVARITGVG